MKYQILVEFEDARECDARQIIKNLLDRGQEELDTSIMYVVRTLNRKIKATQLEAAILSSGNLYLYGHGTITDLEIEGSPQEIADATRRISEAAIKNPTKIPAEKLQIGQICTFNDSTYRRIQFGRTITAAVHPYSESDFVFVLNEDSNTVIAMPSDTQVEPQ